MAFHLWTISEVYSNSDGSVQFIELFTTSPGETQIGNQVISSTGAANYVVPSNLASSTANKSLLFATQGFADLGLVTPDFIIPDGFVSTTGGTLNIFGVDSLNLASLPTNGTSSLNGNAVAGPNSPTNFDGDSASIPGNPIVGTAVANTLSGTTARDFMVGLGGNDKLNGRGGSDTVNGGGGNDTLTGSSGNDVLIGGSGSDVLQGGTGRDILTGDAGLDKYDFNSALNTATNRDTITAYSLADDLIRLDNDIFIGLAAGALAGSRYYEATGATAANDASDRIVYNLTNGNLYFDSDGAGGAASVLFATLNGAPNIGAADFLIIP